MGSPSAVAGWERIQLERAEAWRAYRSHSRKGLHVKGSSSRGRKETRQASTAPHPLLFQVTMVRTPLGQGRRSQSQVGASASHILSVQEEAWLLRGQATRVHQEAQYSPCTTAEGPGQGRAGWWPPGPWQQEATPSGWHPLALCSPAPHQLCRLQAAVPRPHSSLSGRGSDWSPPSSGVKVLRTQSCGQPGGQHPQDWPSRGPTYSPESKRRAAPAPQATCRGRGRQRVRSAPNYMLRALKTSSF